MSVVGPGCVKTCTSQERAKLFSLLPVPDSVCQCSCFPNRQNRDGISTRKLNVGVFTQPGSLADLDARDNEVRFTPRTVDSPHGKAIPERRAPKRQAAWARVAEFGPRTASPPQDASLRLAAQQDNEFRSLAGFRAQPLVRDDQRGSRRNADDVIQCVLRNDDAVERGLCTARVRRHRLNVATTDLARPAVWFNRVTGRTSATQRDDAPSQVGLAARPLDGGEDMRTNRTIGICDRDRTFKDGRKGFAGHKAAGSCG